jgi:hypothetical protein
MAGPSSGVNYATLNDGSGTLVNSAAGFTASMSGAASIHVSGKSGDMAQFYDSPGDDTFYAYADYNNSGSTLAGIYSNGYSNSASGFGTNVGYSTHGGNDFAVFFDSPQSDTFYSYADYNGSGQQLAGMYGSYNGGYSNSAKGFATNLGMSTNGGSDTAAFYDSPGADTFYSYADYNNSGHPLTGMYGSYGSGYSNSANGFATTLAYSTLGGSDLAVLSDSPGNDVFTVYADYNNSGQSYATLAAGYGSNPTTAVSGFGAVVGLASEGGNDTANLYDSAAANQVYTDLAIASLYGNNFGAKATGFGHVNLYGQTGVVNDFSVGQDPLSYQLNMLGKWTRVS